MLITVTDLIVLFDDEHRANSTEVLGSTVPSQLNEHLVVILLCVHRRRHLETYAAEAADAAMAWLQAQTLLLNTTASDAPLSADPRQEHEPRTTCSAT